ncbi:MAG: hypothetical protein JKY65_24295 [Planctomycetes bacterium]|nr:hypothetical protein [Planctomycetota bacterium]
MRIEFVENLILTLVFLTVLGVGGCVVTSALLFPGGLHSGVPDIAVQSDSATERWLADRAVGGVVEIPDVPILGVPPGQATTPAARTAIKIAGIEKSQESVPSAPERESGPRVRAKPWDGFADGVAAQTEVRDSEWLRSTEILEWRPNHEFRF